MGKKFIHNKAVYIVEEHHHILLAWAEIRKELKHPFYLLTFDHHTDANPATDKAVEMIKSLDPKRIQGSFDFIRSDQQIDAAIQAGIIDTAMVISYAYEATKSREIKKHSERYNHLWQLQNSDKEIPAVPPRPHTYDIPENRIYIVDSECFVGCTASPHTDECLVPHANQAIESVYLSKKYEIIGEMLHPLSSKGIFQEDLVVDLDLDYFKTKKSIVPDNPKEFYKALRASLAITIATEPSCVEGLRLDDEINSNYILQELTQHIERALQEK